MSAIDAIVIATAHTAVNDHELAAWSDCIVDPRNAMAGIKVKPNALWKA